jgi:hypothetical protein
LTCNTIVDTSTVSCAGLCRRSRGPSHRSKTRARTGRRGPSHSNRAEHSCPRSSHRETKEPATCREMFRAPGRAPPGWPWIGWATFRPRAAERCTLNSSSASGPTRFAGGPSFPFALPPVAVHTARLTTSEMRQGAASPASVSDVSNAPHQGLFSSFPLCALRLSPSVAPN